MPRGANPKRGEAAKNRTIRVPDHLWERFRAAAPDGNVSDWMIRAGETRLAVTYLRALRRAVGRPVRWAHPRTVEIFNADADEHRPLLRRLRGLRADLDAVSGPVAIVFHTRRESARLYGAFLDRVDRVVVRDVEGKVPLRGSADLFPLRTAINPARRSARRRRPK